MFDRKNKGSGSHPPAPPSWQEMKEDLSHATPSDAIFGNLATHAAEAEGCDDGSPGPESVLRVSRQLYDANNRLSEGEAALKRQSAALADTSRGLQVLLEGVRGRARGALQRSSTAS